MMKSDAAIDDAWPQIGDILVNHGANAPLPCTDLDGRDFTFRVDDQTIDLAFEPGWISLAEDGRTTRLPVGIFRARPGIYLADCGGLENGRSLSLLIDIDGARLLIIDVTAPAPGVSADVLERVASRGSQSAVDIGYRHGGAPFPASSQLVGKQFRYRYSDTHVYDHLYLSDRYYSWFCRRGPDAGLGDFEECDMFEIAEDLVLVCWREKLLPCVGLTLEDHRSMRSMGKIFGADSQTGQSDASIVGADIRFIADISGGL